MCAQEDRADQQEEFAAHLAPRATGETVQFGMHFATLQSADAFCRSYHSPLCQVPGMSNNVRVMTCCALNSAMPRRNFKSENKRGRDADIDGIDDDPEFAGQAKARETKQPKGHRAQAFFNNEI